MPSLIEILSSPVTLILLAMFAALMLWEALAPARVLPHVPGWRWRATLSFMVYFLLSSYLPLLWTQTLLQYQLFDLSGLGVWVGGLVGLLVYQACAYVWHRGLHGSQVMWRGLHQMHHSAERLDTLSAFWFSPTDMIGWVFVPSFALVLVVGLSAEATTVALLAASFLAIFTHTNVRTPRWLGYVVQRPESHSWHHARGQHRYNYSELPVFDMLFGTFRNYRDFADETGFYPGGSRRVLDMVLFRDVNEPGSDHIATPNAEASPSPRV